jgi:hypothetical protein
MRQVHHARLLITAGFSIKLTFDMSRSDQAENVDKPTPEFHSVSDQLPNRYQFVSAFRDHRQEKRERRWRERRDCCLD